MNQLWWWNRNREFSGSPSKVVLCDQTVAVQEPHLICLAYNVWVCKMFCLIERQIERGRHFLPAGSLPNSCHSQSWTKATARTLELHLSFSWVWQGFTSCDVACYHSSCISWRLDGKQSNGDSSQDSDKDVGVPSGSLNHCATMPTQWVMFLDWVFPWTLLSLTLSGRLGSLEAQGLFHTSEWAGSPLACLFG